jgi:hypothetical protein
MVDIKISKSTDARIAVGNSQKEALASSAGIDFQKK